MAAPQAGIITIDVSVSTIGMLSPIALLLAIGLFCIGASTFISIVTSATKTQSRLIAVLLAGQSVATAWLGLLIMTAIITGE